MHAETDRPEDLSDLEQQLLARRPDRNGLDADAMLFAAGGAAARVGPARFVWPAVACLMMAAVVFLTVRLGDERAQRLALADQIRRASPPSAPAATMPPESIPSELSSPNSLLASHRALERGLEAWPAQDVVEPIGPTQPEAPVFQVGQRDLLLQP